MSILQNSIRALAVVAFVGIWHFAETPITQGAKSGTTIQFKDGVLGTEGNADETADTFMYETLPLTNEGVDKNTYVQTDDNAKQRTLIAFPNIVGSSKKGSTPSQIPQGATITSATLYVYAAGISYNSIVIDLKTYRLVRPWEEGAGSGSGHYIDAPGEVGATWQKAIDYYTAEGEEASWEQAGALGATDVDAATVVHLDVDGATYYKKFIPIPVTAMVQAWANGLPNYGFFLEGTRKSGTNDNRITIAAADYTSDNSLRPYLEVTYESPNSSDTTAPTIENLIATTGSTLRTIDLHWEVPASSQGDIAGYEVKYSSSPMTTDDEFKNAATLSHNISGTATSASIILPGSPGASWYIAMKAYDAAGNVSSFLSAGPVATNSDPKTLRMIEFTFQYGDTKGAISTTNDTLLVDAHPHLNFGGRTELRVGTDLNSGLHGQSVFLLQFPEIIGANSPYLATNRGKEQILPGSHVRKADFWFYANESSTPRGDYTLHKILVPWDEGVQDEDPIDCPLEIGATWKRSQDVYTAEGEEVNWRGAGMQSDTDYRTQEEPTCAPTESACVDDPLSGDTIHAFDMTPAVQDWVQDHFAEDSSSNFGVTMRQKPTATDEDLVIDSSESSNVLRRPLLRVEVEVPTFSDASAPLLASVSASTGSTYHALNLSWTVASGSESDVAGYLFKYSTSSITSETDFLNAKTLQQTWDPSLRSASALLPGPAGTNYTVALRAYDAAGNFSNVVTSSATTNSDVYTLASIEVTFQEGGDCKNTNITKTNDTTIDVDASRKNFGGNAALYLDTDVGTTSDTYKRRILFQFPNIFGTNDPLQRDAGGKVLYETTPQIPPGSTILNATAFLYHGGSGSRTNVDLAAYLAGKPWLEGTQGAGESGANGPYYYGDTVDCSVEEGATWLKSEDYYTVEGQDRAWTTPGAASADDDAQTNPDHGETNVHRDTRGDSPVLATLTPSSFFELILTDAVRSWAYDPASSWQFPNYGVVLERRGKIVDIASSENGTVNKRPFFSVEYHTPTRPSEASAPIITNFQATTGGQYKQLDLSWETLDSDIVGFDIRYSRSTIASDVDFAKSDVFPHHLKITDRQITTTMPGLGGTSYYVAMKARDVSGNVSTMVTSGPVVTNNNLQTLETIEVTFQNGGDCKNTTITTTEDTTLRYVAPRWNFGQNTGLWLPESGDERVVVQFPHFIGSNNPLATDASGNRLYKNIEQVPHRAEILDATLTMVSNWSTSQTNVEMSAYPVRHAWREGPEGVGQSGYNYLNGEGDPLDCPLEVGATWNKSQDVYTAEGEEIAWITPGAGSASDDPTVAADHWQTNVNVDAEARLITIPYVVDQTNFFDVSLKQAVQDWVDDPNAARDISPNHGVLLLSNKTLRQIGSSEEKTASLRPMLSVEYRVPHPSDTSAPTVVSASATTGTRLGTIDLRWSAADDVGVVGMEVRYSQTPIVSDADYSFAITYSEKIDPALGNATLQMPDRGGVEYYLALKAYDTAGNYSTLTPIAPDRVATSTNRSSLDRIEVTFQEGGDCKKSAVTKTEDTMISTNHPSFSYSGETLGIIGTYQGSQNAMLLGFPNAIGSNDPRAVKSDGSATFNGLEQIPFNVHIRSATLTLTSDPSTQYQTDTFQAYQLRQMFIDGKFANSTTTKDSLYCPGDFGSTWEKSRDYYTLEGDERFWSSPGANAASDDPAQRDADRTATNMNTGGEVYSMDNDYPVDIDITEAGEDWVENQTYSPNVGVYITAANYVNNIATSEYATTWQRPMLSVEYDAVSTTSETPSAPESFAADGTSASWNNILLSWQELGTPAGVELRVSSQAPATSLDDWWLQADVYPIAQNAIVRDENGNAHVEIPMREPAGSLEYYFGLRARTSDNAWSSITTTGPATSNTDNSPVQLIEIQMQDARTCQGNRDASVTEMQDTLINSASPDNNYGQNTELQYGKKDSIRMLLRWPNLFGKKNPQTDNVKKGDEQIPFASVIDTSEGDLEIYQAKLGFTEKSGTTDIQLSQLLGYPLLKDWEEGPQTSGTISQGGQEGATWNNQRDFEGSSRDVAWSTAGAGCTGTGCGSGADRDETDALDHGAESYVDQTAMDWSIRSLIEQWAYSTTDTPFGLIFQTLSTTSSSVYKYSSGEEPTENLRPLLRVSYYIDHPPHASFDIDAPEEPDDPTQCADSTTMVCDGRSHVSQNFTLQDFSWEDDAVFPMSDYIAEWVWLLDSNGDASTYEVRVTCSRPSASGIITCAIPSLPVSAHIQSITQVAGSQHLLMQYNRAGTYGVQLQVLDKDGHTDAQVDVVGNPVEHKIIVENSPPDAAFEIDPPDDTQQNECSLPEEYQHGTGDASTTFQFYQCATDPEGGALTKWYWDWDNDFAGDTVTTGVHEVPERLASAFGASGNTYPVNLQVEDSYHALSDWATRFVTMSETNQHIGDAYLQTQQGDVYSAQGFSGSVDLTDPEYNTSYYIFTGGDENSVVSFTSPYDVQTGTPNLGFPDSSSVLGNLNVDDLLSAPSGVNSRGEPVVTLSSLADVPTLLNGAIYHVTGGSSFPLDRALTFEQGGEGEQAHGTIIVDGDVTIANNVQYASVNTVDFSQLAQLASVAWIIRGNLLIDPNVTNLAGSFFVFGDQGVATGTAEPQNDVPLRVDGLMMAKTFQLQRRFRGADDNPEPAELIFYDGRLIANPPPGFSDLTSTLPNISFGK